MFGKLLPKNDLFFDLFEQHAAVIVAASQTFLHLVLNHKIEGVEGGHSIKTLEHQADDITHRCIEALNRSFVTPLKHDDIFQLISRMDDIIDGIHEAYQYCLIYKISTFTPLAIEQLRLLVEATEKVEFLVKGLRDRKKNAPELRQANRQIHEIENKGDEVMRQALAQLFDQEPDIRQLIKWKEIYEVLEESIDVCEDVSNVIEGIILEYD